MKLVFVASPLTSKHIALRRKSKNWLARNQDNVSEWSYMSTRRLLFQWANTIKIQPSVLVYDKANLIIISLKINLFSPWCSWKIAELALNNNHSLTHFRLRQYDISKRKWVFIIRYFQFWQQWYCDVTQWYNVLFHWYCDVTQWYNVLFHWDCDVTQWYNVLFHWYCDVTQWYNVLFHWDCDVTQWYNVLFHWYCDVTQWYNVLFHWYCDVTQWYNVLFHWVKYCYVTCQFWYVAIIYHVILINAFRNCLVC